MSTDDGEPSFLGALPRLDAKAHAFVPEQVAEALRREISAGRIPPGAKLPEVALCRAMGVSRHTLRAGLQLLEEDGIARREPNRGVFVASPSLEDLREFIRVRRVLEPGVVRTAVFDADALDALDSAARDADPGSAVSLAEANQAFHRLLVERAGSGMLDRAMERILAQMRLAFSGYDVSVARAFREEHFRIVALLRGGEAEAAARALDAYLVESERRAEEMLDASGSA